MQFHSRRLVEVTKDIDGFKEKIDNIIPKYNRIGEYCHGQKHRKRKRVLQTGYC